MVYLVRPPRRRWRVNILLQSPNRGCCSSAVYPEQYALLRFFSVHCIGRGSNTGAILHTETAESDIQSDRKVEGVVLANMDNSEQK